MRATENCEALQKVEDSAVEHFAGLGWGESPAVCALLNGWEVRAHARRPSDFICEEGWMLPSGRFCVLGFTHSETHTVEVYTSEWSESPLAHELVHVLDLGTRGRAGHCAWQRRGIKAALLKIQGRPDPSESEPGCSF